jgi:hypothetical protein
MSANEQNGGWDSIKRALRQRGMRAVLLLLAGSCSREGANGPGNTAISKLEVTPSISSIVAGDTLRFSAVSFDASGRALGNQPTTWRVKPTDLATINAQGVLQALQPGSIEISAETGNIVGSAHATIIQSDDASIEISPREISLRVGDLATLVATVRNTKGVAIANPSISWRSSDTERLLVDAGGRITPKAPGPVAIVASYGRNSATAAIIVNQPGTASVQVNGGEIGGSGLTLRTSTQSQIGLTNLSGTVSVSTELPQFVFVVDASDAVRGIAISNVSDHRATVGTVDASSTALALLFLSPYVGSLKPGETSAAFARLKALPSFDALVQYLRTELPTKIVRDILGGPSYQSLLYRVIVDYSALGTAPAASGQLFQPTLFASRSFLSPDKAQDEFTNTGLRVVSIWERNLAADETEIRTVERVDVLNGYQLLSVNSLVAGVIDALLGRKLSLLAPTVTTQVVDVPTSPPAVTEFWVVGVGARRGATLPVSVKATVVETLAHTLFEYIVQPILTAVPGDVASTPLQSAVLSHIKDLDQVKDLANALEGGDPGEITLTLALTLKAIGKLTLTDPDIVRLLSVGMGPAKDYVDLLLSGTSLTVFVNDWLGEDRVTRETVSSASRIANIISGNNQSGRMNELLVQPLVVRVIDSVGHAVPNTDVFFTTTGGGQFVAGPGPPFIVAGNPSRTDEFGRAQVYWRLGAGEGSQRAVAQTSWAKGSPLAFSAAASTSEPPPAAIPAIASVSPSSPVPTGSVQNFTINGSNFASGANVTLRDITTGEVFSNRPITSLSATQIVLSTNFGTATSAHSWSVQVTNSSGQASNTFNFTVQATPAAIPSITSVSPSSPVATGSAQTFTINGSNFASGANVTLRDITTGETFANRQISSFTSTQIVINPNFGTATTPHSWSVQVVNVGGSPSNQFGFSVQPAAAPSPAPNIVSITPASPIASGVSQVLTINGSNFASGASLTLRDVTTGEVFANRPIASLTPTQITLSVNLGTASSVHNWIVQVINPDSQSSNQFAFAVQSTPVVVVAPTIGSVSPTSPIATGASQSFTINGNNFSNSANVTLRDLTTGELFSNRSIISLTSTQILINANFGASAAPHNWTVQVTNVDGQASNVFAFIVKPSLSPAPNISNVSPTTPTATGIPQTFTINGSGFTSDANVILRDVTTSETFANRPITSLTNNQIVLSVNFGTSTNSHSWTVQVVNPDSQVSNQFGFTVQATPSSAPVIVSVNPSSPTATGTAQNFTLNGSGFVSGANVILRDITTSETFANRPVSSLTNNQIVLSTNFGTASAPHNWSVQVINPDNQASSQFTFVIQPTPVISPTIASVSPAAPVATGVNQTFTVNGSNFLSGANVTLRDITTGELFSNRPVTSLTATQVVLSVNFGVAPTAHSWSLQITNSNGQASNAFGFTVQATPVTVPTITGLSPASPVATGSVQNFTISGTGFASGANVTLRDLSTGETFANRPIISLTASQILLSTNFGTATTAHNWSVQVANADGGLSNTFGFVVQPTPAVTPAITSVTPASPVATGSTQTFTINGSNFATGANVTLRDITTGEVFSNRPISSLSANQIILSTNFGTATAAHAWSVQVINSSGLSSNIFNFTVQATPAAIPAIASVSPSSPVATGSVQNFTINGSNFASGANVTLRDITTGEVFSNRPITSLSATQIVLSTNFGTATSSHSWSVQVTNSSGQSSNTFNFTVQATPVVSPSITSVSPSSPIATGSSQPFTINGSAFAGGVNVALRDITTGESFSNRPISSLTSTQIVINPNFGTATTSHSWSVQVTNSDGRASNTFNFIVRAP